MADKKEKIVLDVAYQPQVRTNTDTRRIMLTLIAALLPSLGVAVWQFGVYPLVIAAIAVAAAVLCEWGYRKLMHKSKTIGDFSAVVTGLLLAMTLPGRRLESVCGPWWLMPIVGSAFAIVVVKQLYGGIGKNFVNPALAGRAVLVASYTAYMSGSAFLIDAKTGATPLTNLYNGEAFSYDTVALMKGTVPGSIGELSAIAILVGLAILLIFKVISWRIPVSFVGTVALVCLIFGHKGYGNAEWMLYNILSGGLLFGAVFMATDYATSPVTSYGQLVYGCGCGILTVLIRYFGGYPEGVTYAILIMNLCSWAIDKAFHRNQFGVTKEEALAAKKAEKEAAK